MGEAGILREGERVELIEGEIVKMNPFGGRHIRCVNELNWLLGQQIRDEGIRVSVQNPVRLNGGLEPQPDLAVIRAGDYANSPPGPEDVLLVIEVSDTTLGYDRNVKLPLYARAGIGERRRATGVWSEPAGGAHWPPKPSRTSSCVQTPFSVQAEDQG